MAKKKAAVKRAPKRIRDLLAGKEPNRQHVLHARSLVQMAQKFDQEAAGFAQRGSEASQGARLAMEANARVFRAEAVRIQAILR